MIETSCLFPGLKSFVNGTETLGEGVLHSATSPPCSPTPTPPSLTPAGRGAKPLMWSRGIIVPNALQIQLQPFAV